MHEPATILDPSEVSRRQFLASTVAAGAVGAALAAPGWARARNANERIRIGFIGPGRRGFSAHVRTLAKLRKEGAPIDLVAVNDVYQVNQDRAVDYIATETGAKPTVYRDYRDLLADGAVDAVCIGTPDHWHARQTIDALDAGVDVYCEKPMTHSLAEAREVVAKWKSSGRVVQVGVQACSSPVWDEARALVEAGKLGKIVQFQTEYFRNSRGGMTRHNEIDARMTPQTVDWRRWLGVDQGLAPDMPFDRETFAQWRCYWPFSQGMFGDLFVHRITCMLKATGLRYPGRVTAGGGIYLEYDNREVPDVASLITDFREGVQGVVSSSMASSEVKLKHAIRGHHGSIVFAGNSFGTGPKSSFEFLPERPQVTGDSSVKQEKFNASTKEDRQFDAAHFANFLDAVRAGDPSLAYCDPELGAAAIGIVDLAVRSYREGKVFHLDREGQVSDGDGSWARQWEQMSNSRDKPHHVPGWDGGDAGSVLYPPEYQKLAGPWAPGATGPEPRK
jgi:predicted dehydrogenase